MNVLVTGATGVVGRRLVPLLIGAGHRVSAIARAPGKREQLARIGATAVNADLFAPDSLRRAVAGCDAVVNLATHMPATAAQMVRRSAWRENDRIRRVGAANLVAAALAEGVVRLVQESFAPVYPDCGDRWIEETMTLAPARYNESVLDAEIAAAQFADAGGTGVVLRFAAFYGPDSRFLAEAIRQVRRGRAPLPGSPGAFVSSVHHDDAASAAAAALSLSSGAYNVVDDEPVSRREYFDSLAGALGVPRPKLPPPWAKWLLGSVGELLARSQRISNRKIKQACAWTPAYPSVREGWPSVVARLPRESETAA